MSALSINTRAPLSRLRIAQAALAVVDREGLDALSMRRLGAELGVEGMAVYRHFPNKAAVLAGVVEVLLAELVIPPPSDVPWQTVFRELSRAYRALLLRHPHAIPPLAALPLSDPAAARAAGAVMAQLRAAGFDAPSALKTLATITSYVIGVAQWEVGTAPYREARGDAPFVLPPDADPYLVELLPQLAEDDCDDTFEFGLNVIVRGLETRA
ncbi:MAG TPA: TetR/AcrR family transcriptional regulator C-terminal domain-containing protein [Candidatus Limnocylindria bacterium]|nr:TetR/AcrR family transcriptional regulator C-terminal domain-containing protein [Candidatus Limnocylindria bacterium]